MSAVVPILLTLTRAKVLFYCHFPDQLLAAPSSIAHRAYRVPLNWLEEYTTGMAHRVLVNSEYTKGVFADTFSRLHERGLKPAVLYPAVAIPSEASLKVKLSAARSWAHLTTSSASPAPCHHCTMAPAHDRHVCSQP